MILSIVVVVLSECHICQGTAVHVLLWFPSLHYFYFYRRPFLSKHISHACSRSSKVQHMKSDLFLVPSCRHFYTSSSSFYCLHCLFDTALCDFTCIFFLNTRRLRSFFSFWYTSDFLSSLFFCTCDKSASTSIRGIYYTYLYKTYRHLRRL